MASIELKYGRSHFYFEFDAERFAVLEAAAKRRPLSDIEIGERLDEPIGSAPFDELIQPGEKVLLVVPDATREVGAGQVVNILVRRLIANGTTPLDISIIFATGIHRSVIDHEKASILTPFIAQRIKTLDHRPRDLTQIVRLGETESGLPIELNRALLENDHVLLVGGITFHYFAGFTGGRKLICPGLASAKTISATHKLAFDCDALSRRAGVGTGLLDDNAVHEAFIDVASHIKTPFCISTAVNDSGEVADLHCGDLVGSHRTACDAFAREHTVTIAQRRPLVIASCGGLPHDVNLIQAHKTIDAAVNACVDGGTLVILAECSEGLGREDFLKWFEAENGEGLAKMLCEAYQVNGQTAWSLLKKAENYDVRIVTEIPAGKAAKMRMKHFTNLAEATRDIDPSVPGYIIPSGSTIRIAE